MVEFVLSSFQAYRVDEVVTGWDCDVRGICCINDKMLIVYCQRMTNVRYRGQRILHGGISMLQA